MASILLLFSTFILHVSIAYTNTGNTKVRVCINIFLVSLEIFWLYVTFRSLVIADFPGTILCCILTYDLPQIFIVDPRNMKETTFLYASWAFDSGRYPARYITITLVSVVTRLISSAIVSSFATNNGIICILDIIDSSFANWNSFLSVLKDLLHDVFPINVEKLPEENWYFCCTPFPTSKVIDFFTVSNSIVQWFPSPFISFNISYSFFPDHAVEIYSIVYEAHYCKRVEFFAFFDEQSLKICSFVPFSDTNLAYSWGICLHKYAFNLLLIKWGIILREELMRFCTIWFYLMCWDINVMLMLKYKDK